MSLKGTMRLRTQEMRREDIIVSAIIGVPLLIVLIYGAIVAVRAQIDGWRYEQWSTKPYSTSLETCIRVTEEELLRSPSDYNDKEVDVDLTVDFGRKIETWPTRPATGCSPFNFYSIRGIKAHSTNCLYSSTTAVKDLDELRLSCRASGEEPIVRVWGLFQTNDNESRIRIRQFYVSGGGAYVLERQYE